MKLTKQQIEYAFDRIDAIVNERVNAKSPPEIAKEVKPLTTAQKRKQIEDGVATLKPAKTLSDYAYWPDAFVFSNPAYEKQQADLKARAKIIEDLRKAEVKKAQKVKDKIMLSGDAEEALKMLDAYAAGA